jgi:hypothetical protein
MKNPHRRGNTGFRRQAWNIEDCNVRGQFLRFPAKRQIRRYLKSN